MSDEMRPCRLCHQMIRVDWAARADDGSAWCLADVEGCAERQHWIDEVGPDYISLLFFGAFDSVMDLPLPSTEQEVVDYALWGAPLSAMLGESIKVADRPTPRDIALAFYM